MMILTMQVMIMLRMMVLMMMMTMMMMIRMKEEIDIMIKIEELTQKFYLEYPDNNIVLILALND